jgi:hypothetical protein
MKTTAFRGSFLRWLMILTLTWRFDAGAATEGTNDPIARIREEGMNHSQAMETLDYLSDVIGPRLTGSPNMKRANEWTRDKLKSWGLSNAHLEAWGPFGRGWSLERFSAQVIEPQDIPLKAFPAAWSPGFEKPLEARVVFIDTTNVSELDKYAGKLKGAIVLPSPLREPLSHTNALARRLEDKDLLELADAGPPSGNRRREFGGSGGGTNRDGGTNAPPRRGRRGPTWTRFLPFFIKEGVALVAIPGTSDMGVFVTQSASVPGPDRGTNDAPPVFGGPPRPQAYWTNAPAIPAQMTVAAEDYDRMVRMIKLGEKLKMAVDLRVKFYSNDVMAYNTVAEIPGSDLKDEVVMLGGHMDSWHAGTGATDNGVGVAAAMEAVRIIKALDLKPRRTIRVALWSGEEEGLYGSKAYVTKHFGYVTNLSGSNEVASARGGDDPAGGTNSTNETKRTLVKNSEYDQMSAYFNLDNGAGKIRGVYMQGNEAVRPYFRKWLAPFRDLGAETLTPSNTGSTDHVSFDTVGLPGFQFIQDPLDYETVTHHTNQDVYDRVSAEDLKQAATIMAAFVYEAAMLDEKLPRKGVEL